MLATEVDIYQEQFAKFQREQLAFTPTWLRDLRRRGMAEFVELGIPTTRQEDWRFTNISALAGRPYKTGTSESLTNEAVENLVQRGTLDASFHRLVFVNGRFAAQWSSIFDGHDVNDGNHGVVIENLAASIQNRSERMVNHVARLAVFDESAFIALNTAFINDGAFVDIPNGVVVERPVHLMFLSVDNGQTICHPRSLIRLGKGSRATLIESYLGRDGDEYFTNTVSEIEIGESAELDHYKLQHEQLGALHVATTQIYQQSQSRFRSHYFSFGASLVRNEMNCMLAGEEIECTLNGLYMPTGDQHMDCRTRIDHAKPHCKSYELYKGILDDRSRGVFNGKIFVHQDAQKTDAKQSNQALLLSNDAIIDTKPQLEIYADDVRCTHGATIGELDEQAIYYLRSRGIPADLARKMLIFAFANDLVQGVDVPAVKKHLETILLSSHGLPNV